MTKQIIHGIGKAILRDFKSPKKIIGFTDLQDLAIESSSSEEDITGGNKMFPIASFKTDQGLTASGTNATFNPEMMEYLEGASVTVGITPITGLLEVSVPEGGEITLPKTPIADSVSVKGFTQTVTVGVPAVGEVDIVADVITFNIADVGNLVQIVYEYNSSATATEYAVKQTSLVKPFIFDYIFPIYDEDSQISHEGMIKIYKAQTTSGFSISTQHKSPFAPKFEAKAKDPQRVDGKLWTLTIDGVTVV